MLQLVYLKDFKNCKAGLAAASINPSNTEATFVQSTRTQRFSKTIKIHHVGIHWIALAENFQMSTYVPGFQLFSRCLASFNLYWPN